MQPNKSFLETNESIIQKGFYMHLKKIHANLKEQLNASPPLKEENDGNSSSPLLQWSTNSSLPSIEDYAQHITKYGTIEPEVLIYTIILIERFLSSQDLSEGVNLHKIVAVVTFVAQKFLLETELWDAEGYCEFCGLDVPALKELEIDYLEAIEYRIFIKAQEFKKCTDFLLIPFQTEHQN